jgi:acetate kinase
MNKYLIVNTGSVSAKYSIYNEQEELFFAHFEIEAGKPIVEFFYTSRNGADAVENITEKIFNNSLEYFLTKAIEKKIIASKDDISSIGVRVVAPGVYFQSDRIVDASFMSKITEEKEEAPLHVTVTLKEIKELRKLFKSTPIIGISDSAFHKDVPNFTKYYAIPKKVADKFEIYHYGYHGISAGSIINTLSAKKSLPEKIIICHLGGGSSIIAVKDGKSFDTSMGYTPLQGLVTSTRSGDIDPVAVLYLGQKLKKNTTAMEKYLNTECGLLALSGASSDTRDIIKLEKEGDQNAKFALQKFIISIKKYLGSYAAEMDGLDMVVFSGTIGERSFIMREKICTGLDYMGIKINHVINYKIVGKFADISANDSKVKVLVVPTDEMADMAERLKLL